jgi:hypothetical protein
MSLTSTLTADPDYSALMSPIPGEPLDVKPLELRTKDGKKVKLKVPGLPDPVEPLATEERGAAEPPRDDVRPSHNPNHGF